MGPRGGYAPAAWLARCPRPRSAAQRRPSCGLGSCIPGFARSAVPRAHVDNLVATVVRQLKSLLLAVSGSFHVCAAFAAGLVTGGEVGDVMGRVSVLGVALYVLSMMGVAHDRPEVRSAGLARKWAPWGFDDQPLRRRSDFGLGADARGSDAIRRFVN